MSLVKKDQLPGVKKKTIVTWKIKISTQVSQDSGLEFVLQLAAGKEAPEATLINQWRLNFSVSASDAVRQVLGNCCSQMMLRF